MKITIEKLKQLKSQSRKFAAVTCYDSSFQEVSEAAEIEVLLVGDSLGMVIQGKQSTLPVTVEQTSYHVEAVARNSKTALIMADLPFMATRTLESGLEASMQLMQSGAHMIKIEGGIHLIPLIKELKLHGVPVCIHMGLTPQSVHSLSGFKAQARDTDSANELIESAKLLEQAGVDVILVECIPTKVTEKLYRSLTIPLIGIGAGPHCDGQILVCYDLLGIPAGPKARFVKNYLSLTDSIEAAYRLYRKEVIDGTYPQPEHCFN